MTVIDPGKGIGQTSNTECEKFIKPINQSIIMINFHFLKAFLFSHKNYKFLVSDRFCFFQQMKKMCKS